jgi:hypothetical protein
MVRRAVAKIHDQQFQAVVDAELKLQLMERANWKAICRPDITPSILCHNLKLSEARFGASAAPSQN